MSETQELVSERDSWDDERLDFNDETAYIQTGDEYDRLLSKAQMSVVEDVDMETSGRIVGPSGCGKTTLARSLAFDVKIVDELVNEHDLPVWDMTMDKLALFQHIVTELDREDKEMCPNCGSEGSYYARDNKTPTYRCNNCSTEFDELEVDKVENSYYEQYRNIVENGNVTTKLKEFDLVDGSGQRLDNYPHSRAESYRNIYSEYGDGEIPSAPYFEVTMSHAKYAKDLIGHPHIGDNGTTFIKGKVTEAVEASNNEVTILALDEINRAPTSAKDELYDALDGRVKISMDEVGGIEIQGTPENLIIVSTMNKGSGHHVEPLDFAEKRRLGSTYPVDFLGKEYPNKEIELVTNLTKAPESLAADMVECANEIRNTAEQASTDLSYGLPTGTLIEWANEAYTNHIAGLNNPVVKAGESAVAQAIYDHDEDEVLEVESIISKNMGHIEYFDTRDETEEESEESSSSTVNETRYVCTDDEGVGCSWSGTESEAPVEAKQFLICPECDSGLEEKKPGET